jgi:hypothetical protein
LKPVLSCLVLAILASTANTVGSVTPAAAAERSPEFRGYRTYSWVFGAPPAGVRPDVFAAVQASIARQLAAKGYAQAETGEMAVAITLGRRDRIEKTDWGAYGGDIYTRMGITPATGGDDPGRRVTDGTLAIDIYDAATKRPVWHATAAEELPPSGPDQRLIDRAVSNAIKPLPGAAR